MSNISVGAVTTLLISDMFDLNAFWPTSTVAGSFAAFIVSFTKVVKAASVPLAPIIPKPLEATLPFLLSESGTAFAQLKGVSLH